MSSPEDIDDSVFDDLEARLRRLAAEVDPVPAEVLQAARLALSLRDLDAELAELVVDTAQTGLTGVRGAADEPRMLTWQAGEVIVELQVTETATGLELRGQVSSPATPVEVRLEDEQGVGQVLALDAEGSFVCTGVVPARLRLRITGASGRRVRTGWLAP